MRVWLNGSLVDPAAAQVSVMDHGLTVGDGVFETVKVMDGTPFALSRHLRRLASSARGLALPEPDLDLVAKACREVLNGGPGGLQRLRITYTGGPAPMGSGRGDDAPTLIVVAGPLDPWPPTTKVVTVPWTRNERSAVAGMKTTSYADNVVALAHAQRYGATEAIFANTRGRLCEGTGSNVFVVLDGTPVTPTLSTGCLAGVTRALIIEWADAQEADLPISVLQDAEEVFLVSTTRDVQGVHAVDDRMLDGLGPVTRAVAETFARRSSEDLDP